MRVLALVVELDRDRPAVTQLRERVKVEPVASQAMTPRLVDGPVAASRARAVATGTQTVQRTFRLRFTLTVRRGACTFTA